MNLFIEDFLVLDADVGLFIRELVLALLAFRILDELDESFKFAELLLPTPPPRLLVNKNI